MAIPSPNVGAHRGVVRNDSRVGPVSFHSEEQFRGLLSRERRRSERSRQRVLLMLVDQRLFAHGTGGDSLLPQVGTVLCQMLRDTDLVGWFGKNSVLGVIFTELGSAELQTAVKLIESRVKMELQKALGADQIERIQLSFYAFPEAFDGNGHEQGRNSVFYADLCKEDERKRLPLLIKRIIDILGSTCALILLAPIFLILAILIKLTSKGPVLFCQQRVGQFGVPFTFFKFRSMCVSSDTGIHEEYARNFIAGKAVPARHGATNKLVYKLTNDPRVTWIGKFMRRTSLDELPQFWNVLKGEMSLVGPRPPVPYENEAYDIWHRRRLLEAKPGITGLWQVYGRSKTTFDEMVRLDLLYARTWSPLLDIKILLLTPRAVFSGDGAC